MISIKVRMKIHTIKQALIKSWYKLMRPIGELIIKYDNHKYHKKEKKTKQWTDEYAMKLCAKVIIRQLIRSKDKEEWLTVASGCDECSGYYNIQGLIINQYENKKLITWGYNLPFDNVDKIEQLTDLLKQELEKYKEIECHYEVNERSSWYTHDYKKDLIIKLKENN